MEAGEGAHSAETGRPCRPSGETEGGAELRSRCGICSRCPCSTLRGAGPRRRGEAQAKGGSSSGNAQRTCPHLGGSGPHRGRGGPRTGIPCTLWDLVVLGDLQISGFPNFTLGPVGPGQL